MAKKCLHCGSLLCEFITVRHSYFMTFSLQAFMTIQSLADAGVKMGLNRDQSIRLSAQVLLVSKWWFHLRNKLSYINCFNCKYLSSGCLLSSFRVKAIGIDHQGLNEY